MHAPPSGETRALIQEIYLQELSLGVYAVYERALRDERGREILKAYQAMEAERRRRIEDHLARSGAVPAGGAAGWFRRAGGLYGWLTSLLGTRIMLRIALSASRRATRRACGRLGPADRPDLIYLASLRARSEGELRDALTQHLIDTRPRRGATP